MNQNSRNPISWVPTVYFAMGLPFVVLNMVSVLMFKGLGIGDAQIALWTSLIMLPWTLKFLWSPFLEMFKTKKFFVVLTQLITGAGFALVALALHLPAFFAVCIALLAVIAFSGATHDVATDGVYMSELNKQDQAKYIGWQGAFYNIAKIVASGGLVWLAGWLLKYFGGVQGAEEAVRHEATVQAWMMVMLILAAVMVFLGVYHMRMLPSGGTAATGAASGRETWNRLVEVIRAFFQKKHIWYYVAFIILYRLAEGFVMKIVPLFLKAERSVGGLGLGEQEIGLYYGTYGAAAFVLGSLLAGYYISHRGLSRTLFSLCCVFNLPFLAYTLLAIYQPENGMLNSIIGLFRDMTDPILWKGEKLVIPSIIIAMVWQAVGYYMVMYMASMSAVPISLYESANLDGAGRLTQFFQITIPLIWTNIRTTLTFFIISTINMAFLFVKAMTSGGPNGASDVALSYMYSQKDAGLYGYSMAIGVVIFLFSFALSACVNKVTNRDTLEF